MTGAELRDAGLDRAGSGQPASVLVSWQLRAHYAILQLCRADSAFSADDVRRAAGDPPTPNAMGGVLRWAFKRGLIRPAGYGIATRPERHASVIRYWQKNDARIILEE